MYKKYIKIFYLESCIKKAVYSNKEDCIINAVKVNNPRLLLIFSLSFVYIVSAVFISSWFSKLGVGLIFWSLYMIGNLKLSKNIYFFNSFLRAKVSRDWNVFRNTLIGNDSLPYNLIGIDAAYNGFEVFKEKAIPNLLRMKNSEKNCENSKQITKRIFLIFLLEKKYEMAYSYLTSLDIDMLLNLKENEIIEVYKMFLSIKRYDKIKIMSEHILKYKMKNMYFLNELTSCLEKNGFNISKCIDEKEDSFNRDVFNYIMIG